MIIPGSGAYSVPDGTPERILDELADETAVRDMCWHPGAGDVVIDVGAYWGSWTFPALAPGARVHAVEPSAASAAVLLSLARQSPELAPGVLTLSSEALAEEGGYPQAIRDGLAAAPWHELYPPPDAAWTTLDKLAAGYALGRLDWLKIDVEGGESSVLRGATGSLRRFSPVVVIEDHTAVYRFVAAMDSAGQCLGLLGGLGYQVTSHWFDGGKSPARNFWICRKPPP